MNVQTIHVGELEFITQLWDTEVLSSNFLSVSFHVEDGLLHTAYVFDGEERIYTVPGSQIHRFVSIHKLKTLLLEDVKNDFRMVDRTIEEEGRKDVDKAAYFREAKDWWWEMPNQGRIRSCCVLDMLCRYAFFHSIRHSKYLFLIRLAKKDELPSPRSLKTIWDEYFHEEGTDVSH